MLIILMEKSVRVRFAPSPTGPLHIGGVRTALFNYLFAKKHNGSIVLRIEDTDKNRTVEGAEQYIIDALDWCGIGFDESPKKNGKYGPYRQSERKSIYLKHINYLLDKGSAYYAFDSAEALNNERKNHEEKGKTFIYNWHNRTKGRLINSLVLSKDEVDKKISSGEPYVIRFKSPNEKEVLLSDIVRGEISIDSKTLDDKILYKSDGMPTYHLANVVDDHLMEISHVIRGEEWLPSLALHKLLYDAFGWEPPKFAHLPLILKPKGKGKLSKRDGDKLGFPVFPLEWKNNGSYSIGFKESGYMPEALINFLSFLGWNPGTEEEIFDMENLINCFSLSKINKAGARFDTEKIKWFNQHYISNEKNSVLANFLVSNHSELKSINKERIAQVVGLIKDRANLLTDLWPLSCYFFVAPLKYDEKGINKAWKAESGKIMSSFAEILIDFDDSSPDCLRKNFESWVKTKNFGFGSVIMPLRLAIVGALKGADIFDIIHSIGKNETVSRIKRLKDQV